MTRVFTFGFLPIPHLNYDLIGREQHTAHQKVLRLTARFFNGGKNEIILLSFFFLIPIIIYAQLRI